MKEDKGYKLAIGIINWNTANLLNKCLTSISNSKTDFSYKVFVVDNNSDDNSLSVIKTYKKVRLLQNKENLGMAASLNQIINCSDSEYLLFLHPDTEIGKNTIQNMLKFMDSYPKISVAGPKLVYPNNKIFLSCHKFPTLINLLKEAQGLNGVYMRWADHSKIQCVDIIASACFFLRRDTLKSVGLFDEKFTNWMSEWDLCYRITESNEKMYKIVYAPISTVIHHEGMSETYLEYKKHSYPIANLMLERLLMFYEKHYSKSSIYALRIFSLTILALKSARYLYDKKRIKGYFEAVKMIFQY